MGIGEQKGSPSQGRFGLFKGEIHLSKNSLTYNANASQHFQQVLLAGAALVICMGMGAHSASAAQCLPIALGIAAKVPTVAMTRQSDSAVIFSISDMPGSELAVSCYFGDRFVVEDVSIIWDGGSLSREKVIAYGARLASAHTGDEVVTLESLSKRCLTTAMNPDQSGRFQAINGRTTLSCLHIGKGFSLSFFKRNKSDYEN